jgi:MOSC domain-containing protein YiiM
VQLHLKPREGRARGLPKRAAPKLTITPTGVEGDFNRWRTEKANGDPDQAVLLLTEDILSALQGEGWPVRPGELGENLTLSGLPLGALELGAQVHVGKVVLEVSKPCDPCTVLYTLPYVGTERGPAFIRTMRGRRGWFARVLRGGTVRPDMAVQVSRPRRPTSYAIKAAIPEAEAKTFAFTAQKTMYGGKKIAEGDTVFAFASETQGGHGLIAQGVVTSVTAVARKRGVARQTPRVSITVKRTALSKRPLGRNELRHLTDWSDGQPGTELNFKLYRQATNKIVGISDEAASFLRTFFA